eukprot:GHVS01010566.1.p1 GENE.GHVS01010566.1~~GHVS01010566.1.p1  ORF type:complete len:348 (+),score=31.97 GHVS01010566.1:185-1228(+)
MAAPSTISVHPSCTVRGGLPIPSAALSPSAPSSKGLPVVGFGTWKIPSESCDQLVFTAIQQGYTHIDTALVYGNERQAGNGIKRALEEGVCTREELFISSKLWNTDHRSEHVRAACERSLRDLQISQLDLYLVHLPVALKYTKQFPRGWVNDGEEKAQLDNIPFKETWQAMEALVRDGLVASIGVSNCSCQLINDLMTYATIRPVCNQVECHPYLPQLNLASCCRNHGIIFSAYSPFGDLSYQTFCPQLIDPKEVPIIQHPTITRIASAHNKTNAQVILRWHIQRDPNSCVLVKSSSEERIRENIDSQLFDLTETDIEAITALGCNRRYHDSKAIETLFGISFPIFD